MTNQTRPKFKNSESFAAYINGQEDCWARPSGCGRRTRAMLKNGDVVNFPRHGALGPRCKAFLVKALASAGMLAIVAMVVNWGW